MAEAKKVATGAQSKDVDKYIATAPAEAQPTLVEIRKIIRSAVPEATEVINYGIPTFKLDKAVVSFGAAKNHCGFYVMSTAVMGAHRDEVKGYKTGKGSINFPFGAPLPEALIKKLVKARIEENAAIANAKK